LAARNDIDLNVCHHHCDAVIDKTEARRAEMKMPAMLFPFGAGASDGQSFASAHT